MRFLFLFPLSACVATSAHSAKAGDTKAASLRELDVYALGSGFGADAASPGPVIVACESENGGFQYGPSADPRINVSWTPIGDDGPLYIIGASAEFVSCHLWAIE